MQKSVNLNCVVKVKLTQYGKDIYLKYYYKIHNTFPKIIEDENGYSMWQLWYLMQIFGNYLGLGLENPFNLNILIDQKDIEDIHNS